MKDHCENWPVKSGGFGKWLRWQFYRLTGKAPSTQAFQNAVNTIAAKAIFQGQERRVFVRIAGDDDVIYLDLVNDAWQSVRVDAEGWKPIDKPPVRFIRRRGMLPLPIPERGCGMGALRTFANIPDDAAWVLVLSFLVAAFRARGLYPVLVLHGEQGSAKSTLERLLRELIDPNVAPLRSEPRNARDLIIAATNSWMLAFDNVKGGVKLDHQGGAKPDHYGNGEGFVLLDLRGWLERRPAPPLGGAFRPEWKAPLQIVATCRQGKSGTTFGGQASWGASACFP